MEALRSPTSLALLGATALVLLVLLAIVRKRKPRLERLVAEGKLADAARLALEQNQLEAAFDLFLRAQLPENAAAVAVRRGDLALAAELYERAGNWERAVHFYERAGNLSKVDELRRTRLRNAPPVQAARPGEATVPRSRQLEQAYQAAKAAGPLTDGRRAELQRMAREAADALLADGDIGRAADLYADAELDDEAIHLCVNVLGQPGKAAPLVARRGNHQRAAELYELAGQFERAAGEWVDVARASPRPASFIERIAGLSPDVALRFVEDAVQGEAPAAPNAELHYQRARLIAGAGDLDRAEALYKELLAAVGPYRDAEQRLATLRIEVVHSSQVLAPAAAPATASPLDAEQVSQLAAQVAEAAAQQLRRRVELGALPSSASDGAGDAAAVRGLEHAPLQRALLADAAVAAARHGPGRDQLLGFAGGRACDLGNIEVYYRLGLYHLAHGDYDDALAAFDAVEEASPGYRDAWRRADEIRAWKAALGKASRLAASDATPNQERYQLRGELGRGGMAVVYRAVDTLLGRDVAIKFLSENISSQPGMRELFQREARAVASLNHPNIVTVHDTGFLQGRAFLCMELVDGQSVESLMASGELTIVESLRVAKQVLDALGYAHARKVVHRDIKPANVMRTTSGLVKLMDFGLAKSIADGNKQSVIAGTPSYMPPEQLAGLEVDARTDLFAVAVSMYEMLCSRLPFEGFDRQTPPVPISVHVPAIPQVLEEIVMRGLAYDPRDRWASAAEMNGRLAGILEAVGSVVGAGRPRVAGGASSTEPTGAVAPVATARTVAFRE